MWCNVGGRIPAFTNGLELCMVSVGGWTPAFAHERLSLLDREHGLGLCVVQRRRLDPRRSRTSFRSSWWFWDFGPLHQKPALPGAATAQW